MKPKIKILVVNEFSQLSTGFSTYMKELIPRLLRNPNFEVAEHACYINESHIVPDNVTWKIYPNEPHPGNKADCDRFGQNRINQFGRWKFDEVCIDFQPDIVISIRDYWMDKFIEESIFRKNFKWIHMPTVDGEPQKEEWLETYGQCDLLLTYSLWAKNLLESQSGGKIKVFDVASPCTDLEMFHVPEDRKISKKNFGLNSDLFLIMTVMRNQPRKLFPQLMESFVLYLEKLKAKGLHDLAAKSFLYCHTSYPDVGWELSEEVKRHKLSHKVIFTYTCNACQIVFPSFFNGEACHCRNCGNHAARFPNTGQGISREALAKVMQCADIYVQYSVCVDGKTNILTSNGWKEIEKIDLGEMVFTDKGEYKPVINKMVNDLNGRKIYKISAKTNNNHLICTEDHPVLAISQKSADIGKSHSLREYLGRILDSGKSLPDPQFIEAEDIQNGDMGIYLIDDSVKDIKKIDLIDYTKDQFKYDNEYIFTTKEFPRYLDVNNNFCKFLGLYIADGSCQENGNNNITHSKNDLRTITIFNDFVKDIEQHSSTYEYKNREAVGTHISSKPFSKFLFTLGKEENKQFPNWVLWLPKEKQIKILEGLFSGDGHYSNTEKNNKAKSKRNTTVFVTISKKLAEQVEFICRRLRLNYNLHIDPKTGNRLPQYRFEIAGNCIDWDPKLTRSSTDNFYLGNIYYIKLIKEEILNYQEKVYNIEVKDHNTYLTKTIITHNCEGWSMPPNDAKACGTPCLFVDYSAMTEQAYNGGGIPIKLNGYLREPISQTNQYRAVPDDEDLAQKLFDLATDPKRLEKLSREARACVEKYYNWDMTAKVWENAILSCKLPSQDKTWFAPPQIIQPNLEIPNLPTNEMFVEWCYNNVIRDPSKAFGQFANKLVSCLNMGYEMSMDEGGRPVSIPVDRQKVLNQMLHHINQKNSLEIFRYQKLVEKSTGVQKEVNFVEV